MASQRAAVLAVEREEAMAQEEATMDATDRMVGTARTLPQSAAQWTRDRTGGAMDDHGSLMAPKPLPTAVEIRMVARALK